MRAIDADALEKEGWSLHRDIQVDKNTWEYQTKPLKKVPTIEPDPSQCWGCNCEKMERLEPCEDTISRQDAIRIVDGIDTWQAGWRGDAIESMKALPSAQPEPCGDVVSRNAIVQKLNEMDRYVSTELRLCDTDKKFPQNEVFIVDDVYEEIVEQMPSAQPDMSEYSDKLWKAAYERGKAEAQPDLEEVYAHAETEAEARYHAEIVRCEECKYAPKCYGDVLMRSRGGGYIYCPVEYCSAAEMRTDESD